jgi:hypothetical protein
MSFSIPLDSSGEFLLTEDAFGVHEGPVSYSVDASTSQQTTTAYTEFHTLSVISPHIVMILRDNSLPEPLADKDNKVRDSKRELLAAVAQMHNNPDHATSMLQDLPVAKARNSYTVIKNGRLVLAAGVDSVPRGTDTFTFPFFRLESRHVQTINTIMLDQAHNIFTIVYKSDAALCKALEFYLSYPTCSNGNYSTKTISERSDDPTLLLLRKLEHVAHILGSEVEAKYHVEPLTDVDATYDNTVAEVLRTAKPPNGLSPSNPLAIPVTVLVEVLEACGLNIRAAYAIDVIFESDDRPSHPELTHQAVQRVDREILTEHTGNIRDVDLRLWNLGWHALVKRALQGADVDLGRDVEEMRRTISKLDLGLKLSALVRGDLVQPGKTNLGQAQLSLTRDCATRFPLLLSKIMTLMRLTNATSTPFRSTARVLSPNANTSDRLRTWTERLVRSPCPQCKTKRVPATRLPIVHSHKASLRIFSC